jgi:maleamate amidohydrolase
MSELALYRRQGFGAQLGIQGRIGLLIVDFVVGFADPASFGGGNIPNAIQATVPLLHAARHMRLPVAYSRIVFADDGADANVFALKVPSLLALTERSAISSIVPQLTPGSGELVVRKTAPSAFFGTSLHAWFTQRAVQTILVAGSTTSGCVRASVVDAVSYGFRPIVVADCVGDRASGPHASSLFDMEQKYADVVQSAQLYRMLDEADQRERLL